MFNLPQDQHEANVHGKLSTVLDPPRYARARTHLWSTAFPRWYRTSAFVRNLGFHRKEFGREPILPHPDLGWPIVYLIDGNSSFNKSRAFE